MPICYWQYVHTMKGKSTDYLQENLKNNSAQCNIQSSQMNSEEIPVLRFPQWSSEACLKHLNSLCKAQTVYLCVCVYLKWQSRATEQMPKSRKNTSSWAYSETITSHTLQGSSFLVNLHFLLDLNWRMLL